MRLKSLFFSESIKICIMLNSLHFQYYQIFIVLNDNQYLVYGEKYPGVFFEFGKYTTLKGAKVAARKFIKPYPFLEKIKPEWGPTYEPEKIWLEKFNINNQAENLKIKLRAYLLNKIGQTSFLIEDNEDLRQRHFFLKEDEKNIQGIVDNSGFQLDIKNVNPLSLKNIIDSILYNEASINIDTAGFSKSCQGQAEDAVVREL